MNKRIVAVKKILHNSCVDMGTFGLIELELLEMEKECSNTCIVCKELISASTK